MRAVGAAAAGRRGFTLIEILAVVAILALAAVLVLPNLAALGERRLRHAAQRLAAELEFARQRAVVTGIPHRVLFDLDNRVYRIEWLGAAEEQVTPVAAEIEYDVREGSKLPLTAPQREAVDFTPLPDTFGNFRDFDGDVHVAGLETADGWVTQGLPELIFEPDGSTAYTEIVLEEGGGARQTLAVQPLDDAVRFVENPEQP